MVGQRIEELLREVKLNNTEKAYIKHLYHRYKFTRSRVTLDEIELTLLMAQRPHDSLSDKFKKFFRLSKSNKQVFTEYSKKITNSYEQKLFIEAVNCFSVNAFRAAAVMLWIAVIHHFYKKIDELGYKNLQDAIKIHFPRKKYKKIDHKNKLSKINDRDLFLLLQEMNIIDLNKRHRLEEHLKFRNSCSHTNPYNPLKKVLEAYIEDLVENFLSI